MSTERDDRGEKDDKVLNPSIGPDEKKRISDLVKSTDTEESSNVLPEMTPDEIDALTNATGYKAGKIIPNLDKFSFEKNKINKFRPDYTNKPPEDPKIG